MKNILFLLFTCVSFGQAGSFDASYGNNGLATFCYHNPTTMGVYTSSFQSSGKIVTYNGIGGSTAVLLRWNTDGTIDTTFGDSGTGTQSYFQNPPFVNGGYSPKDMAIQEDDKIVIMGLQQNPTFPSNAYWVARLLPDGALDTSFNGTGYLDLSFGTTQDRATSVALQTDGKILVGGTSGNTAQYFTVARLNPDGSLDTGFGNGGKVQTPFSGNESFVQTIAVQPDGKIVAGGYTVNFPNGKDFAIVRYNADGSIDTDFGDNGKVITTISSTTDIITELIIELDGKIVAGGYMSTQNSLMCMVRYNADGSIDASFGVDGIVINDDDNSRNCSIARQADGKYLMAGALDGFYFLVIRYNSDGTKDSSFGAEGVVYLQPIPYGHAAKVLIQADNKIVACGITYNEDYTEVCFANARLNPGTLNTDNFISQDLKLYPNPTTGEVFFRMADKTNYQCAVYNMMGQKVRVQENVVNGASVTIDNLPKGAYMFALNDGKSTITKTIILK